MSATIALGFALILLLGGRQRMRKSKFTDEQILAHPPGIRTTPNDPRVKEAVLALEAADA